MERFLNETAADLAANHARHMAVYVWGDDVLFSVAVNACGNCGETAERLNFIPEYGVKACDVCMADIADAIQSNGEPEVMPAGACPTRYAMVCAADTIDEMRLALRAHESECAQCGSTKKTVIDDRLLVNAAAVCCGEAA
jgi:precorrin-2 methylase